MVETLLAASRSKSGAEFNYDGRPIEIFYNRGRKGNNVVVPMCSEPAPLQDDVNKKIPTCSELIKILSLSAEKYHNVAELQSSYHSTFIAV